MLVHLSMVYACDAGHERRVYCGHGVEGPADLKADPSAGPENPIWIASPFYGGPCPECGAPTRHIRWHDDEVYDPPIEAPSGVKVYTFPGREAVLERMEGRMFGSVFLGDVVVA